MDYVKDEFGNIIGYKGDDLSQQQAKLSGIPQGQVPAQSQQVAQPEVVPTVKNNIFAKPQQGNGFTIPGLTPDQVASMTYTDKELEAGHQLVGERAKVQPQAVGLAEHGGIAGQNGQATRYNPQPRPQITNMDELASAMGYTSPEEEARLRKASVNNQRILAVADALRHIGNIANTVNYAPAQRFNQPWAEEQMRYEHGKAQRDRANNAIISYQQQRAELDRKIKQAEAEAARKERQMAFEREKWETQKPYYENRGKAQEYVANTKKLEYESKPKEIEGKLKAQDALAYQRKSSGDAAMVKANAYAADRADASRKRGYSGGGSGGGSSEGSWTRRSDGSSWRGKQNKSDVSIQEYGNKDKWYITEKEWNSNYARINNILMNSNPKAASELRNAKNETERKAIAQKYATSTKETYNYMRGLAHGHVPGNKQYASAPPQKSKPEIKPAAKGGTSPRKPNPNGQRQTKMVKGRDGKEREYELDSKGKIVINY